MASTSDAQLTEYKLRCTLQGHTSDVRSVAVTINGDILTASRDKTSRLWKPDENSGSFISAVEFTSHTGYVTAICALPPDDIWPEGLILTGSKDTTILVYQPSQQTPIKKLTGHTDSVSCLSCVRGTLVSGSWDHTTRVWSTTDPTSPSFTCEAVLKAHNGPVWAALLLPNNQGILTGAADHTIILWKHNKVSRKFQGHSDCVRGLTLTQGNSFLSCSNDAAIKLWDLTTGVCTATFYGHTSFIYSISSLPDGWFVTGAEDRSVRVWSAAGNCQQTIHMPCQSVWSVASLPTGDICIGTSDGSCRVFTRLPGCAAPVAEQAALTAEVAAAARPAAAEIGGVDPSKLPDKSVLHIPGTKDGKTIMVREDDKVMCYSWSAAKTQWEAVGEVVGGAPQDKVLHNGKEYDFVFNVELDEGAALKLPYNKTDDPYVAAQAFVELHELPQDHLDQVAKFIITNSGVDSSAASSGSTGYYDPFTGGNRYVPGTGVRSGSGRGVDPFTSSGGYVPSGSSSSAITHSTHFPQTTSLLFEACNKAGITNKFKENNLLVDGKVRLTDAEQEELIGGIFVNDDATNIDPSALGPLEKALQWSPERVWPSLDLLRLCLRSKQVQDVWVSGSKGSGIVALLMALLEPPSTTATQLLAIRCLANLAAHQSGCDQLTVCADRLLSTVSDMAPYPNKNIEIAAATLLLNCAVLLTRNTKELSDLCQVLSGLCSLLLTCKEPEALYRSLVGVGTVVAKGTAECRQFAVTLDIAPMLHSLANSDSQKVKECAQQVNALLTT